MIMETSYEMRNKSFDSIKIQHGFTIDECALIQ